MKTSWIASACLIALTATGCSFSEGLIIRDLTGKIVLPPEAATRTIQTSTGEKTITDVRLIGPVYLGLYASVIPGVLDYPHPEMGPIFKPGIPGDTYPYGGTTVGDLRFGCMEFFTCKMTSGRFVDFDDIVSWHNDVLEDPITDEFGEVTNGEYIRQRCYDIMNLTSDEEIRITATEDKNGDGALNQADLDFVLNSDGDYEATFKIWQQDYLDGFTLWGWMDAPSGASYKYSTCNEDLGFQDVEYVSDYTSGIQQNDLLNTPSKYIASGDWVSSEGHVYQTPEDEVVLRLDFPVGD